MSCATSPVSSSESSIGSVESNFDLKCEICCSKGHGNHFGVTACRACAAFFRRMIVGTGYRQKCRSYKTCEPKDGRWQCKKCRLEKCYSLGMTPDNIQHDRDLFQCSLIFREKNRKRKLIEENIPKTVEKILGIPHLILFRKKERLHERPATYIDLSSIIEKTEKIFRMEPDFDSGMSTLEKLTFGLKQSRLTQQKSLSLIKCYGKEETCSLWEAQLTKTATWLMYFDGFRELPFHQKFSMFKRMWHVWGRLERLSMTAEMRVNGNCGKRQFVVSHDSLVDYDATHVKSEWSTRYSMEELRSLLDIPTYYSDSLVDSFINVNPTDTELAFILGQLCLKLTGKMLGGDVEEVTQKLQDVLANDLHEHYKDQEVSRYAHRLTKLLSINNDWQSLLNKRRDRIHIAMVLDAFHVEFSHPDLFQFSV